MNWQAMGLMATILCGASIIATLGVYMIERGLHPFWFVAGMFLVAILMVGVLCR